MKSKKKVLVTLLCAALLVFASVMGTLAWMQDNDAVKNTFTVGKVDILLNEAPVDENGIEKDGARVQRNDYKIIPGMTYDKDPMVTVVEGSNESYVRMMMTISNASELDAIFAPNGADMMSIFKGYDSTKWIYKGNTKDAEKNTRTYEFWYYKTVDGTDGELEPLFTQIAVPGTINGDQLATINGMTIDVEAHAIQKDGFVATETQTAEEVAWAAFSK